MRGGRRKSVARLVVACVLSVTAITVAACGDSDEPETTPSSSRATVVSTVEGMYRDMAAGDSAGVCSVMSVAARRQIAQQAPGGSTAAPADRTCEKSIAALLRAGAQGGAFAAMADAKVSEVKIKGGIAVATVSLAGSSGKIRLLREAGAWRFGVGAVAPPS